eukprot:CAMPEP_0169165826 /NCGR_PEP_ID=MMETSP1015-20121227/59625_1 /TAXON_ID=342587 /ORGANISM="Karlodinium micrum, Strain CCMP2283" /LENGTH=314 /DNA_ID=CAMNT_0009238455 /DNA_START=216 /DNA_END=1160 /DNA_ORIENTATION=-
MATGSFMILCKMSLCLVGCWLGALGSALWAAVSDEECSWSNAGDYFMTQLLPREPIILGNDQLRYSSSTVAFESSHALFVYEARPMYSTCAFFYQGRLFTTDNDVLYAARLNSVEHLKVTILRPFGLVPETAADGTHGNQVSIRLFFKFEEILKHALLAFEMVGRLRGQDSSLEAARKILNDYCSLRSFVRFVMAVIDEQTPKPPEGGCQPLALILPADAFPTDDPRPRGHVILEVDQIINARAGRNETLCNLIAERCPRIEISEPEGVRAYARVKLPIADESIVRAVIKQIARERGKRTNIKLVEQQFYSPRD